MQNLRVAVDVGGTFTDICIMDETTGLIRIEKTASSRDPIDGIMSGLAKAAVDLSTVALFSHGTTVATNALRWALLGLALVYELVQKLIPALRLAALTPMQRFSGFFAGAILYFLLMRFA